MQTLVLTILVILFGSAILSCVEAALFSVSLSRIKVLAEKKKRGAVSLLLIKENMRRPITVLVIFTNVLNIVGSIIVGVVAVKIFGNAWLGAISVALTFLIIIFGEIIPKSFGESHSEKIALAAAKPLFFITKIFSPFIWIIEKITDPFTKKSAIVSEEEIRMLSHLGHLEGSIEEDEKEMINKVFRLNDLTAKDIMTPRTVVVAFEEEKTLAELEERIYNLSRSRLPMYHKNLDNITGVCHERDLLTALARDEKERKIAEFRQEVIVVPESMKADKLLPFFQKQKCHLAVVIDEFGGTSGIVTLEDVLEQLVGEIVDEKDKEINTRIEAKKIRKGMLRKILRL